MVDPTGGATAKLHQSQQGTLPGLLGFEMVAAGQGNSRRPL